MLDALGITSVDQLFDDIPEALRASRLDLPEPEPELELAARLTALAEESRQLWEIAEKTIRKLNIVVTCDREATRQLREMGVDADQSVCVLVESVLADLAALKAKHPQEEKSDG